MKKNLTKFVNPGCRFTINDSNILKGIAVLLLLIHHCFLDESRYEGCQINFFPFHEARVLSIAGYGKVCLAIFVFVSAYGLTVSYSKVMKNGRAAVSQTAYRRLWKLYTSFWPAYVVSILGCVLWAPNRLALYAQEGYPVLNIIFDILGISYLLDTSMILGTWWYLSLAIVVIFLVPIILAAYQRFSGIGLAILFMLISRILDLRGFMNSRYNFLLVILLGIWMADTNFFERLQNYKKGNRLFTILKIVITCFLLLSSYKIFHLWYRSSNQDLSLVYAALAMCLAVSVIVRWIPVVSHVLSFIGRHSMNIFIIHNFIRAIWFDKLIYSLEMWWLIVLALLVVSLGLSVLMEMFLKLIHYKKFVDFVEKKITSISK